MIGICIRNFVSRAIWSIHSSRPNWIGFNAFERDLDFFVESLLIICEGGMLDDQSLFTERAARKVCTLSDGHAIWWFELGTGWRKTGRQSPFCLGTVVSYELLAGFYIGGVEWRKNGKSWRFKIMAQFSVSFKRKRIYRRGNPIFERLGKSDAASFQRFIGRRNRGKKKNACRFVDGSHQSQ